MANAKKTEEVMNWLVGIGGTEVDGVMMERVTGTKKQVVKHLVSLVRRDRDADPEGWDYGSTAMKDVVDRGGELYAYGVFSDYHIDYSAVPEKEPTVLE